MGDGGVGGLPLAASLDPRLRGDDGGCCGNDEWWVGIPLRSLRSASALRFAKGEGSALHLPEGRFETCPYVVRRGVGLGAMMRMVVVGRVATPSRFELPISSLTGRRVRPLHHGAVFRTWALGEICPATVS